jgi:hypothetical protein
MEVLNNSGVEIVGFYLAKTETVEAARQGHTRWGTESEALTWGDDLLSTNLVEGSATEVLVKHAGRWDARPIDDDGRFQHIVGLQLKPGGRYRLEINSSGWRSFAQ